MSDAALSEAIGNEGIDILIDLSGHSANNRLLAFARKPAPIQVGWIGYLGTTGLSAMDYYLADRFLLPREAFEMQFVEKIIHLPAAASYYPREDAPVVNSLPALRNGYLSFGSFNRVSKLSPAVVSLWSQLLRALPLSRMFIGNMREPPDFDMVAGWFAQEGIARDRLSVHLTCDPTAYLGMFHSVDVCLDSFPYTGFTTTMDAMWMGVPTLTLAGCTPPSRQSAAVLSHLGLEEFVAKDSSDFVAKGVRLASDHEFLYRLRVTFRERIQRSILGQPEVIAAAISCALRAMWLHWCQGSCAETQSEL
jgi:protein O-GlcNAc transferase